MSDWIDTIRIKFENEVPPPIEEDWDYFESNYLRKRSSRRVALWAYFTVAVTAASLLLFLFNKENNTIIPDTSPSTELILSDYLQHDRIQEDITPKEAKGSYPGEATDPDPINVIFNQNIDNELLSKESFSEESAVIDHEPKDSNIANIEETISPNNNQNKVQRWKFAVAPFMRSLGTNNKESVWMPPGLTSLIIPSCNANHSIPLSYGLNVSMIINERIAVTGGADISIYHSRIAFNNISSIQNAYYLGIPLRLDLTVWHNGPVSVWFGGGGKVDRLVYGKFGTDRIKDNTLNWSIIGDLGIQYDLSKNVGIFLAPEVSYYFKPENPVIQTYRTENPLMFTIGAGLRFSL